MLDAHFLRTLEALDTRAGRVLIAVSGGRDSMVLLELFRRAAEALPLELVVGHVNHGLRAEESDDDEHFVRERAEQADVDFVARHIAPQADRLGSNSRSRPTLEEASRNRRRAALLEMATEKGCAWIATAHHAGDQAETVLLRILRGTGPDGLAAMAAKSAEGRFLKPLLDVMPEEIADWAEREQLPWREDESNQDRRFARNRLRHDWIPGLAETFNPQLLRTLANLAEAERRDLEWIDDLVREAAKERIEIGPSGIQLAIDGWADTPDALARRLVRLALVEAGLGRDVTRAHLERILAFLRRGRAAGRDKLIELPEGTSLRRLDEVFLLSPDPTRNGLDGAGNATVLKRE